MNTVVHHPGTYLPHFAPLYPTYSPLRGDFLLSCNIFLEENKKREESPMTFSPLFVIRSMILTSPAAGNLELKLSAAASLRYRGQPPSPLPAESGAHAPYAPVPQR